MVEPFTVSTPCWETLPPAVTLSPPVTVAGPSTAVEPETTVMAPPTVYNQGTASLSYPIIIPPGRKGVQPQLAVTYDSGSGNGWLGVGWNLAVPTIEDTAIHAVFASTFNKIVGAADFKAGKAKDVAGITMGGNTITVKFAQIDPNLIQETTSSWSGDGALCSGVL